MAQTIPDFPLEQNLAITSAFAERGMFRFSEACEYVRNLPYGRTTNRAELLLVLKEGRGTCSSKHALLAALARENAQPVKLMLGVFLLNAKLMPEVKYVQEKYQLDVVPEVHTYLVWCGERFDFTDRGMPVRPQHQFVLEEEIEPHQVDSYKPEMHREFIAGWLQRTGLNTRFGLDEMWQVREECIAARSEQG